MPMGFAKEVLVAILECDRPTQHGFCDDEIAEHGQTLFGKGWGGKMYHSKRLEYGGYPLVAMQLGKLRKRGLVQGKPYPEQPNYRAWKLTAKGRQLAEALVGEMH